MALQTPRQRLQRPSYGTTNSAERPQNLSASTAINRKASLNALNGQNPKTPAGRMAADSGDLEIGDVVNVPGEMYGTVKFIGSVRGKNGRFVGVELDPNFAARGKNDGDVDGTFYFNTTIPGAGIFLPVHRAEKRFSPTASAADSSYPGTPGTPSYSTINGTRTKGDAAYTPPTPAVVPKFSQSVGPGATRPASPSFKAKRPSLPRPESPIRRTAPTLAPTPARGLSQSQRGGPRPGLASTTTPSKTNLRASTTTRPSTAQTPRPYSRTGSRLGQRQPDGIAEDARPIGTATTTTTRTTSTGSVPSFSQLLRSPSRLGSAGGQDAEIARLKKELVERDKRLEEQAASLAEMEASVKELSAIIPADSLTPGGSSRRKGDLGDDDEQTAAHLRQLLREKNEKISLMTQDFDAHRADFRSTLDSLEMASTETERVYEEQRRELMAQIEELQAQNHALQEELAAAVAAGGSGGNKEDFESVAQQLKGLEDLVAELEEGLEESRRGEAEARGEVEFLRGEVERGRSELRREREKAAALQAKSSGEAGAGGATAKELEQKDDEIRGLKAIVHSLSTTSATPTPNGDVADPDEVKKLRAALDESKVEKEKIERELEQLRRDSAMTNGHGQIGSINHARNESEQTATASDTSLARPAPLRQRSGTLKPTFAEHARLSGMPEQPLSSPDGIGEDGEEADPADGVYCEMCQSREHDTLECTKLSMKGSPAKPERPTNGTVHEATTNGTTPAPTKEEDKWCALCEKDGHLAFDCPEEQY